MQSDTPVSYTHLDVYKRQWKDKMVQCDGKTLTYDEIGNLTAFDYAEYQLSLIHIYGAVAWNIRTIGIRMIMKVICPMLKIS